MECADWLRPGSHGCPRVKGGVRSSETLELRADLGVVARRQRKEPPVCGVQVAGALFTFSHVNHPSYEKVIIATIL